MKLLHIICSLALAVTLHAQEFQVSKIFGDHMVLQRELDNQIWGSAAKGSEVTVEFRGKTASAKADATTGRWRLKIPTGKAGGPFELTVKSNSETVTFKDVLVGEVWICVGQSNMEAGMGPSSLAEGLENKIRLFNVKNKSFVFDEEMAEANREVPYERPWRLGNKEGVKGFSVVGFHFALNLIDEINVPIGMISCDLASSDIEAWMSREALRQDPTSAAELEAYLKKCPLNERAKSTARNYSFLYSTMLRPIMGYGIKGALYYQGEDNLNNPELYANRMKNMVLDWRKKWGVGEFSFYCVQIAPFGYQAQALTRANMLHQAQLSIMDIIPRSGTAIQTDIPGTWYRLHPGGKGTVGKRLALWALNKDYGRKDVAYTGPLYQGVTWKDGVATFDFRYGEGLHFTGDVMKGIQILDDQRTYYPAVAKVENDQLIVSSPVKLPKNVGVRYGWLAKGSDYPLNLFNKDNLPAAQFRTDQFESTIESPWLTMINAQAGANGSIFPSESVASFRGDCQVYLITPDPGYKVGAVLVNGTPVPGTEAFKFQTKVTDVRGSQQNTIEAHFEPISSKTYTVKTSANKGGVISPSGTATVHENTRPPFAFHPDIDQRLEDVLVDGKSVGAVTEYKFPAIKGNHTLDVKFASRTITEWDTAKGKDPIDEAAWSNGLPHSKGSLGVIKGQAKTSATEISDWTLLIDGGELNIFSSKLENCHLEFQNKATLIVGGRLTLTHGSVIIGDGCYFGKTHRDITLDNKNHQKLTTSLTLEEGGTIDRRYVEVINGAQVSQKGGTFNTTGLRLNGGGFDLEAGNLNTGRPNIINGGYLNFPAGSKGIWSIEANEIKESQIMTYFQRGGIHVDGKICSAEPFTITSVSPTKFTIQLAQ
jgi:sialate O-acetylesterase